MLATSYDMLLSVSRDQSAYDASRLDDAGGGFRVVLRDVLCWYLVPHGVV